jgi:hypothetical protein
LTVDELAYQAQAQAPAIVAALLYLEARLPSIVRRHLVDADPKRQRRTPRGPLVGLIVALVFLSTLAITSCSGALDQIADTIGRSSYRAGVCCACDNSPAPRDAACSCATFDPERPPWADDAEPFDLTP